MQKLKIITALVCSVMLSGCQKPMPVYQPDAATSAPDTLSTEQLSAETSKPPARPDGTEALESNEGTSKAPATSKPLETESYEKPEAIPEASEEELPPGTIRTDSKNYREIASLVLKSVYGGDAVFYKGLPTYLAKGYVDGSLWFAVRFILEDENGGITREALIREDEHELYSLVTINKRVPTDNLIEDSNASTAELDDYLCYMLPFQNTGIFEGDYNFKDGELPPADALVHAAQRLIGEQPSYDEEEVLNALTSYIDVTDEYLKASSCYRQENESYRFSEYDRTCQYALKSAVSAGSIHKLTIYAAPLGEHKFTREIILTVDGTPEEFSLVSCAVSERAIPEYSFPITIAESPAGENLTIELQLSDGCYYEAGGQDGLFKSGFKGNYGLILKDDAEKRFVVPASVEGFGFSNYPDKFKLSLVDYDGDGNLELALGVWDENGMAITIYRIKDNQIFVLSFDGVLKVKSDSYSPMLQLSEGGFSAEVYDEESDGFILKEFILTSDSVELKETEPEGADETEE